MAQKAKIELNTSGVKELLKSQEMLNICKEHASRILNNCPSGYEMDSHTGPNRVNAMVYASTYQAKADNLRNNTLLKAVKS